MTSISVKGRGPIIDEFKFDLPEDGGLVVIEGPNGCGKTTILHTVEVLLNGRGSLSKSDGVAEGSATGFGRTLRIKKRTTFQGDLEIEGVGDLDISTLHSPKFAKADVRDQHRIKTLVRLSGVKADISRFYGLVGNREEFDRTVGETARQEADLVDMTSRVKRDLETGSRAHAEQARTAAANARSKRDAIEGIDLEAPHDSGALNTALELAIEHHAKLRQVRDDAAAATAKADEARKNLDDLVGRYSGESVEDAKVFLSGTQERRRLKADQVQAIRKQLESSERELAGIDSEIELAEQKLAAARAHTETVAEWRKSIDAAREMASPSIDEIAEASEAVEDFRAAVETGAFVRAALVSQIKATASEKIAKEYERRATELRTSAKECETILSEAVQSIDNCPLRVWFDIDGNARLVTKTPRSPNTLFDSLSDGERWKMIVPMALAGDRLVVLPQAAYGELQPANRLLLHELARKAGGWILSAEATDGPMGAVVYGEQEIAAV